MTEEPKKGLLARMGKHLGDLQGFHPRADAVVRRMEGVVATMEKVLSAEMRILSKLEPIVDDLAQLVRLELNEALERRGLKRQSTSSSEEGRPPSQAAKVIDAEVIAARSKDSSVPRY